MNSSRPLHDGWTVSAVSDAPTPVPTVAATVPGCVHTDLLAAGLIPDPYLDDNETRLGWIGRTDWRYDTTFTWSAGSATGPGDRVDLVCDGLDTVATVLLNGTGQENQAAFMGNGITAMELMGQWGPSTEASFSTDKKGQGDKIKFFAFPEVEGGKGKITDCFGGTDGYAVSSKAPKEALTFLEFLLSADSQRKQVADGGLLPVTKGAEDALKDPEQKKVQQTLATGTGFQLYLDQAYAPAIGAQINDSCTDIVLGKATPEAATKAITNAAKSA